MKKYIKPEVNVIELSGEAVMLGMSTTEVHGQSALSKRNEALLWEEYDDWYDE